MAIEVDFISLPQVPIKKIFIDLMPGESYTICGFLKVLAEITQLDFLLNREHYLCMVNSLVVTTGTNRPKIQDGDKLTIMPLISGG